MWYDFYGPLNQEPWTRIVQTEYQVLYIYSFAEPCKTAPNDYPIELAQMDKLLTLDFLHCIS